MTYATEVLKADVAVVGGGLAGSSAALKAADLGLSVVVLERANTYRSGDAGAGIDHLFSYVPPVHERVGYTKDMMKEDMASDLLTQAGLVDRRISDRFVDVSYERITELERYGIKMRFEDSHLAGGFRLVPQFHSIPTSINFEGRDIKVRLTEAMRKAGIRIVNRAVAVKITKDGRGRASGVIAVSSRDDVVYRVRSKAVILATNSTGRRLGGKVNIYDRYYENASSSGAGFGISLPLEAGAEVANLEFSLGSGELAFRGFSTRVGSPGSSWWPCAQVVDDDGEVVVHRIKDYSINEPDYLRKNVQEYSAFMDEFYAMHRYLAEGRQLYMDLSEATDEELAYVEWTLGHEGRMWLYVQNLKRDGINLRDVLVPYVYDQGVRVGGGGAGVLVDWKGQTTVPGLYAAGDMRGLAMGSGPCAIVSGDEAAIGANEFIGSQRFEPGAGEGDAPEEIETVRVIASMRNNPDGETWQNFEQALRSVVATFGAQPLTDAEIAHALELLGAMRDDPNLKAENPHEVARCFEALSLLVAAEAIFRAAEHRDKGFRAYRRAKTWAAACAGDPSSEETTVVYGLYREVDGRYGFRTHDYRKRGIGDGQLI